MHRHRGLRGVATLGALTALLLGGCSSAQDRSGPVADASATPSASGSTRSGTPSAATSAPVRNVYAANAAGALTGAARTARPMVYVPNTLSDSVQLIDPATYMVVDRFSTGREPQHVVPSWDLKTLWVNDCLLYTSPSPRDS